MHSATSSPGDIASLRTIDAMLREMESTRTVTGGSRHFGGLDTAITVENVSFPYPDGRPVPRDVSFRLQKNGLVAVAGASGSGKSTLADLLMRLIEQRQGTIRADGIDIREFDIASSHARIGFVSQDCFLFNRTVAANIAYGADSVSQEQVVAAATAAHAHDFIMNLPQGYDTLLGERGVLLSGGERQRVSLARALYGSPDIPILDEAKSALDSGSEKIIQESIREIRDRCTILVIAHRLSTIGMADEILVMEDGRIVERGTCSGLLENKGAFARFHALQMTGAAGGMQGDCSPHRFDH